MDKKNKLAEKLVAPPIKKETTKTTNLSDKKKEWKCEDECLEDKNDNGNLCGETDHF